MKNKKGFTLVELMVIIVILVILMTISLAIYNNTAAKARNRLLDSFKTKAEIAAEKWANDKKLTDSVSITVNRLILEGYLESDNENGEILSPVDNIVLNCNIIFIEYKENNYYAKYQDAYDCNLQDQELEDQQITITANELNNNILGNLINIKENVLDWTNKNVRLILATDYTDVIKIEWYQNNALLPTNTDLEYSLDIETSIFINTYFKVNITIKENEEEVIKTKNIRIRIDKEKPVITNHVIESIDSSKNLIRIFHNDNKGSEITQYYYKISSTNQFDVPNENAWLDITNKTTEIEVNKNLYLYIIFKDKAGNISDSLTVYSN